MKWEKRKMENVGTKERGKKKKNKDYTEMI